MNQKRPGIFLHWPKDILQDLLRTTFPNGFFHFDGTDDNNTLEYSDTSNKTPEPDRNSSSALCLDCLLHPAPPPPDGWWTFSGTCFTSIPVYSETMLESPLPKLNGLFTFTGLYRCYSSTCSGPDSQTNRTLQFPRLLQGSGAEVIVGRLFLMLFNQQWCVHFHIL